MKPSNLEHTQADIIWTALAYNHMSQWFIDHPYVSRVREKVDALFLQIGKWLEHVHTDSRRSIYEYNWSDFSIQKFEVHSGDVPLGNHFHKKSIWFLESHETGLWKLSELFVFDEGWGSLFLQDIDPEWAVIERIEEIKIRARDIIAILPFQAHTLFLEPGTRFRWFRPYPFDRDDMDMNSFKLELPK